MTAETMPGPTAVGPSTGDGERVPAWMVLLVGILFVGVAAVGTLVVLRLVAERAGTDPTLASIAMLTAQVEAHPADVGARRSLAHAYQQAGRYDEAVAQYERVLRTMPDDLASLYNLGVIADARGEDDLASAWWRKVLKVDPTHVLAAKMLGERLARAGEYEAVLAVVGPAAAANPYLADLDYLMGVAYEKTGDRAKALEMYRLAVRYSPDLAGAAEGVERLGAGTP